MKFLGLTFGTTARNDGRIHWDNHPHAPKRIPFFRGVWFQRWCIALFKYETDQDTDRKLRLRGGV